MSITVSLLLWVICLSCHAWLQPGRYGLPPPRPGYRPALWGTRLLAPVLALLVTTRHDAIAGILVWCMTASLAGLVVACGLCFGPRIIGTDGRRVARERRP
ncbi:hypothetical protein DY926_10765 [Komagataeibacter melaceti]|uniref:Uncharacterized protein n=1 Tax=Komagataeibacter melaceti TaxID=2766577 RepID=A0A371YZ74_9PROT|nr:hypothetical protein [Komagataeibacter melaceti]RFD19542.1 hypothetical protein DY926_10765 [Komagataeibacter melaceti]